MGAIYGSYGLHVGELQMNATAFLIAAGLGILFSGRRAPNPGPSAAVGDSIVANGGFLRVLNSLQGYSWQNFGVVGNTTGQMLSRSDQWARASFTEILIMGCINDFSRRRNVEWTIDNMRQMYELARGVGARLVVVTSTPWDRYAAWNGPKQLKQNRVLQWQYAGADGLADVVVDAYHPLADPARPGALRRDYAARDQLHLNRSGQNRLGEVIIETAYQSVTRAGS